MFQRRLQHASQLAEHIPVKSLRDPVACRFDVGGRFKVGKRQSHPFEPDCKVELEPVGRLIVEVDQAPLVIGSAGDARRATQYAVDSSTGHFGVQEVLPKSIDRMTSSLSLSKAGHE